MLVKNREPTGRYSVSEEYSRETTGRYSHRVHRVATAAFWRTFSDEDKIGPSW